MARKAKTAGGGAAAWRATKRTAGGEELILTHWRGLHRLAYGRAYRLAADDRRRAQEVLDMAGGDAGLVIARMEALFDQPVLVAAGLTDFLLVGNWWEMLERRDARPGRRWVPRAWRQLALRVADERRRELEAATTPTATRCAVGGAA